VLTTILNANYLLLVYRLLLFSSCSFLSKAIYAEEAGAKAVIIMDNNAANDDTLIEMVDDDTHRTTGIPAYFLLGKDGFVTLVAMFDLWHKLACKLAAIIRFISNNPSFFGSWCVFLTAC